MRIRRPKRGERALTIEYAILMMLIVTAFVALILTSATLTTDTAADYSDYISAKSYLDRAGDTYIREGGVEGCLSDFQENEYGFTLEYDENALTVKEGDRIALTVRLADTDADGVKEVTMFRYGA